MAQKGKSSLNSKPTENKTTVEQRTANTQQATVAIQSVKRIVEILKPWELAQTERFRTYQYMLADDAVWSSVESRITSIEVAQSKPRFIYNKKSKDSVFLKEYLDYCLHTMKKSTRQLGRDCGEMVYNGIAPFEIVTSAVEDEQSKFNKMFTLHNLAYIDPLTIDTVRPYVTKNGGREVAYWRQRLDAFRDTNGGLSYGKSVQGAKQIDARKIATASYASSSSRPLGYSPLDACYTPWREKVLLQDYLLMGVQKDLAGTPVLRVPLDLFNKAKEDGSDAQIMMSQLVKHMTNLHQGDQSFCILPSDSHDSSSNILQYDITFKGVEGNNKQFDLVSIIEQKKRAIYSTLGTSHLLTGENGGGSYNLYEGGANSAAYLSRRDNMIIADMWNKTIIPLLLRLNNINVDFKDVPVYVSGEVQPLSIDELGKFAQRVASVGMMPITPKIVNHLLEGMGTTERVDEDTPLEELKAMMSNYESRAGEGEGTSGTGNTQIAGSKSDTNSENAS